MRWLLGANSFQVGPSKGRHSLGECVTGSVVGSGEVLAEIRSGESLVDDKPIRQLISKARMAVRRGLKNCDR